MLDEAGGDLAVASRRLMASVDAEFPEDEKSPSALEQGKTVIQIENTSTSSIRGEKGQVSLPRRHHRPKYCVLIHPPVDT
jgi:hypothetical protein